MPHNPEQARKPDREPRPYALASRFPTKQEAEQPYVAAQETIRTMDCDLSAYRFLRQWQEPGEKPWYVAVIGEAPPDAAHTKITEIFQQGEMTPLPDQVVAELYARRVGQTQHGSWVERHYTHSIQRRNPKKDKLKRKMQDKSRRRNRGT